MANDFEGNRICYSIGVGPQVIWDTEMAERGMEIYQYDHTVESTPDNHPNFHFNRIGISHKLDDPQLITLESMLEMNDHLNKDNMLLKIDVEGAEWDVFENISSKTLMKFDQIVVEFHGLNFFDRDSFRVRADKVFRNIAHSHSCIHIHGNNYGSISVVKNIPLPEVIEITYARHDRFEFIESHDIFPTRLDDPCNSNFPDLFLGNFKYRCQ
jgi:hypothetical protein